MPNKIDLTGRRFGFWLVITEQKKRVNNGIMWKCVCDCGSKRAVSGRDLNSGKSTNCGCIRTEKLVKFARTHGKRRHPLYNVWYGLIRRCYEQTHIGFPQYGGKGVIVCDEWRHNFQSFYDWAVANEWKRGMEIDKDIKYKEKYGVSPGKIYSPDTCCIITKSQNLRNTISNRLVPYNGEIKPLIVWCEILNIQYARTRSRLVVGKTLEWCVEKDIIQ